LFLLTDINLFMSKLCFPCFPFQVLRKGLLRAAKTTGAWIFTGGTNTGRYMLKTTIFYTRLLDNLLFIYLFIARM
jgi:SLOG in TRPM